MMGLTTYVLEETIDSVKVAWTTGLKKYGVINVIFPETHAGHRVIAEIVAIRHLMYEREIFDRFPMAGAGHRIVVSSEPVHDLITGFNKPSHLAPYAAFLYTDLAGALLEVDTAPDWIEEAKAQPETTFVFDPYVHTGKITYNMPAIGKIRITQHAVQRYGERNSHYIKTPQRSLLKFLSRPEMHKTVLPPEVKKQKEIRYGSNDHVEAWTSTDSTWVFLFAVYETHRELLTAVQPVHNNNKRLKHIYQESKEKVLAQQAERKAEKPKKQVVVKLGDAGVSGSKAKRNKRNTVLLK